MQGDPRANAQPQGSTAGAASASKPLEMPVEAAEAVVSASAHCAAVKQRLSRLPPAGACDHSKTTEEEGQRAPCKNA